MAMAMGIIGSVVSAAGAMAQASAAAKAADYNAKVAEKNAVIAKQNALADEQAKRRETRTILGNSRAAIGASGLDVVGSPLDVLGETAALGELDALTIRYNGENNVQAYKQDAELERMRGQAAKTQGFFGAASALVGGMSQAVRTGSVVRV